VVSCVVCQLDSSAVQASHRWSIPCERSRCRRYVSSHGTLRASDVAGTKQLWLDSESQLMNDSVLWHCESFVVQWAQLMLVCRSECHQVLCLSYIVKCCDWSNLHSSCGCHLRVTFYLSKYVKVDLWWTTSS